MKKRIVDQFDLNKEMLNIQTEINYLLKDLLIADDEEALEEGYCDPFVTIEQKHRDIQITKLLTQYVQRYEDKSNISKIYRWAIFIPCMIIIAAFAVVLIVVVLKMVNSEETLYTTQIVGFVTACVSFISLIIGLLSIITKYFFPENDEEYITKIVETIQKNDLENKIENAKNQNSSKAPK